jgi:chromosome segregation ATPase
MDLFAGNVGALGTLVTGAVGVLTLAVKFFGDQKDALINTFSTEKRDLESTLGTLMTQKDELEGTVDSLKEELDGVKTELTDTKLDLTSQLSEANTKLAEAQAAIIVKDAELQEALTQKAEFELMLSKQTVPTRN